MEILESNLFDIFGDTAPISDARLEDLDFSFGDLNIRLGRGGAAGYQCLQKGEKKNVKKPKKISSIECS